jgi:hypothetical protein
VLSIQFFRRLGEVDLDPADGDALQGALHRLVMEARPEDFQPMANPYNEDPGFGFEFDSEHLNGIRVYFKVRLIGQRPRVQICSLHRPDRFVRGAKRG